VADVVEQGRPRIGVHRRSQAPRDTASASNLSDRRGPSSPRAGGVSRSRDQQLIFQLLEQCPLSETGNLPAWNEIGTSAGIFSHTGRQSVSKPAESTPVIGMKRSMWNKGQEATPQYSASPQR